MRVAKIVILEILLILGSVLIYRSALTILDRFINSGEFELGISLAAGLAITAICLYFLNKVALRKS